LARAALLALFFILALSLNFPREAVAYLESAYLGGFPGLCEDGLCYDDGHPRPQGLPGATRNILEHQVRSEDCPTDLFFITLEYPANTGNPDLDEKLAGLARQKFEKAKIRAKELACNDFFGCAGLCLPVGAEQMYFLYQSSPNNLSVFLVDRFFGNFRGNRHVRGQVDYTFLNFEISSGLEIGIRDIFPDSRRSVPLFWDLVDKILAKSNNCPSKNFLVSGRQAQRGELRPRDLLLSSQGATLALFSRRPGTCRSQALDIPSEDMIGIGANPILWADDGVGETS
jgi:hypothetical protein